MLRSYKDILSKISENPKWWDAHGVPRYCDFHPDESSNVYADEVALLRIACQSCLKEFDVELNWSEHSYNWTGQKFSPLSHEPKLLHYGDPPNSGCCPAGHTMNCIDLRILEFWKRSKLSWERKSELEIELERLEDYFGEKIGYF